MDESVLLAFDSYKTYNEVACKTAGKAFLLDDKVACEWAWKLATDKNLLVFGLGDKFSLLNKFAKDHLKGEDLIELNGNPKPRHNFSAYNLQNSWMKNVHAILDVVSKKFLKLEEDLVIFHSPEGLIQACLHLAEMLEVHYGKGLDDNNESLTDASLNEDDQGRFFTTGPKDNEVREKERDDENEGENEEEKKEDKEEKEEEEITNEGSRSRQGALENSKAHNGGRYAYNQTRLYLVIHSICGPLFSHADAHTCLSILAGCKCVSILASVDMLNVSLFWDGLSRMRYSWSWYHVPTYIPSSLPDDHPFLIGGDNVRESTASNRASEQYSRGREDTMSILSGFPTSHKEFLQLLCKYCLEKRSRLGKEKPKAAISEEPAKKKMRITGSSKSTAGGKQGSDSQPPSDFACVPIDEVLKQGTAKLILKSKQDINEICKNFFDHHMLQDVRSSQFGDFLKVLLPLSLIEEIAKMKFA